MQLECEHTNYRSLSTARRFPNKIIFPALCVIGLFKPTFIIRDAPLFWRIAGLPRAFRAWKLEAEHPKGGNPPASNAGL